MNNRVAVVAGSIVAMFMLGCVTYIIISGKDPALVVGMVSPVLSAGVMLMLNNVNRKVDTISSNVNGHLSDLAKAAGIQSQGVTPASTQSNDTAVTRSADNAP